MSTKPILFSTQMVQAILEGRKTQTRRTQGLKEINFNPDGYSFHGFSEDREYAVFKGINGHFKAIKCTLPETILWVRETWKWEGETKYTDAQSVGYFYYKASEVMPEMFIWKPSIFMPKEACRIFLEVTNVRVERVQDISGSDAIEEGINPTSGVVNENHAKGCFQSLWQMINGSQSWHDNPWVWVYDFKRVERPENFLNQTK